MGKQSFLYGTLVLIVAGFITKILGFIYRITLSRIIGDEGMGLFQMAFPILIFAIVITTAGLPVAISKLVSEAEAKNDEYRVRSILTVSLILIAILSTIVTISILIFAPIIANTLLTDSRAIYCLMAIAPMIPIIGISSVFRGYFQGKQNMNPYALSQLLEQSVRIFTVLFLAQYLLPFGISYAAAGAVIGMVVGEGMGMLYLLYSFKKDPQRPRLKRKKFQRNFDRQTFRELIKISIPVTVSRAVGSFAYAIEPIVVAQSLAIAGIATATSTALYGQLEGMAIPLVFFPSFITYALSISLVPAISEAAAQNQHLLVEHRFTQAIRLSCIIGAPSAVLIYVLAEPLATLLYHQPEVAHLMRLMAPFGLFLYIQGPLASILQGLDHAQTAMRNSIIGAFIKTILICCLASNPNLGIDGVALAINCGIIVVTVMHFLSLSRLVSITIHFRSILKLIFASKLVGLIAYLIITQEQIPLLTRLILSCVGSLSLYAILLFIFSLIKREDLLRIPMFAKWMR